MLYAQPTTIDDRSTYVSMDEDYRDIHYIGHAAAPIYTEEYL